MGMGCIGKQDAKYGKPGGSVERKCWEAANGCWGGNGADISENSLLFLLHEWGEAASSSGVATTWKIQILISEHGSIQYKRGTAASEGSCYPLAMKVCTQDVKT